jgi:hypothetical protein
MSSEDTTNLREVIAGARTDYRSSMGMKKKQLNGGSVAGRRRISLGE